MNTCAVEGCDRPAKTRGWCVAHYTRWRRHGDPGPAKVALKGVRYECSLDTCTRDATSRGLCGMHYLRLLRHGTVERKAHPRWKSREELTYDAAHDRVKRYRGRASEHPCSDCGGPAEDWAYQHHASDPLVDEHDRPYSDDLNDYAPMCRGCHRSLDISANFRQQGGDHLFIVTVYEAAHFAGTTVPTIRSWVQRGMLEPVRAKTNPLVFRYEDVVEAQRRTRTKKWRARHAEAVARWRDACAS